MYLIELKISDEEKAKGFNPLIYKTHKYEFKGEFVVFKDKFDKEMVIATSKINMIREIKSDKN